MTYISLNSRELVIQFDFESPMTITSEDEIEISLGFNEIDKGFNQRTSIARRSMQKQLSRGASENLELMASTASGATVVLTSVVTVGQTILSGSLSQVWGMINGLQIMVHLPTMNVDFPVNVMKLVNATVTVATFDVPGLDIDSILQHEEVFNSTALKPPSD